MLSVEIPPVLGCKRFRSLLSLWKGDSPLLQKLSVIAPLISRGVGGIQTHTSGIWTTLYMFSAKGQVYEGY